MYEHLNESFHIAPQESCNSIFRSYSFDNHSQDAVTQTFVRVGHLTDIISGKLFRSRALYLLICVQPQSITATAEHIQYLRRDVPALSTQHVRRDVPGWKSLGCYTDSINSRTLSYAISNSVAGGASNMTVENCINKCAYLGYRLAGVEYAQGKRPSYEILGIWPNRWTECYCDDMIQTSGALAPDGNATCNMNCAGDSTETCGGSNRINVYSNGDSGTTSGNVTSSAAVSCPANQGNTYLTSTGQTFLIGM